MPPDNRIDIAGAAVPLRQPLPPLLARDTVQHFLAEARRRPRPSVSAVQDLDAGHCN